MITKTELSYNHHIKTIVNRILQLTKQHYLFRVMRVSIANNASTIKFSSDLRNIRVGTTMYYVSDHCDISIIQKLAHRYERALTMRSVILDHSLENF